MQYTQHQPQPPGAIPSGITVHEDAGSIDQRYTAGYLEQAFDTGSHAVLIRRHHLRDECLVGSLRRIGGDLQQAIDDKDNSEAAGQPDTG